MHFPASLLPWAVMLEDGTSISGLGFLVPRLRLESGAASHSSAPDHQVPGHTSEEDLGARGPLRSLSGSLLNTSGVNPIFTHTSCVTLAKTFNLSELQLLHLQR